MIFDNHERQLPFCMSGEVCMIHILQSRYRRRIVKGPVPLTQKIAGGKC